MPNSDQIKSFIRSLLLAAGAGLVASGKVSEPGLQEIVGGIIALGSVLWSQFHHKAAPKA